jgi:hypothetical protein
MTEIEKYRKAVLAAAIKESKVPKTCPYAGICSASDEMAKAIIAAISKVRVPK